ncbi:hypothetical protein [Marinitoga aeolica]|uniref:Uncharacterized protein n=1 Tax=Marinitoga aeolica TaxID=2809031 RepID=A0ABY8PNM7_9BACT|nr:hypothetical protein [Marinitoga aeolica]WGS64230.1 hypothetical protein JRV97_07550 [Marinitoga aeolica]
MKVKKISIYILLVIFFSIFLSLSQIIFDYIFQKEPYLYYGSFPIESNNLKFSKEFPQQAKAVLSLEGNILKVYLPKNSKYFDLILKDLKVFLYDTSIKLNKIVKPYFIEKENLKTPEVYNYYIKIIGLVFYFTIFISGRVFTIFDKNNLILFMLHYYKEFFKRFIFLLFNVFSFIAIALLVLHNIDELYVFFIYALLSMLIASVFENIYLNILISLIFSIIPLFLNDIIISLFVLIVGFIICIIYNYISIFYNKIINVKEEKKVE